MSINLNLDRDNLALTSTLLSKMQESWQMFKHLNHIVGDTNAFVLSGCEEEASGGVTSGFVVVNNEIMPFAGAASIPSYLFVIEEDFSKTMQDGGYNGTKKRLAAISIGVTGSFSYSELKRFDSILSLMEQIATKANSTDLSTLSGAVANKVDKDGSKVLSTNDFTTELKTKLSNIQDNANAYAHPEFHDIGIIPGLGDSITALNNHHIDTGWKLLTGMNSDKYVTASSFLKARQIGRLVIINGVLTSIADCGGEFEVATLPEGISGPSEYIYASGIGVQNRGIKLRLGKETSNVLAPFDGTKLYNVDNNHGGATYHINFSYFIDTTTNNSLPIFF